MVSAIYRVFNCIHLRSRTYSRALGQTAHIKDEIVNSMTICMHTRYLPQGRKAFKQYDIVKILERRVLQPEAYTAEDIAT